MDQEQALKIRGLSGQGIRLIAIAAMLCDHVWVALAPQAIWLHYIGRMAFPLFAFLIVEGFFHTPQPGKYLTRLLLLAVVSEIPFDLMQYKNPFYLDHQNVLWTLALGLASIMVVHFVKSRLDNLVATGITTFVVTLFAMHLADELMTDFRGLGVLTVVWFYTMRNLRYVRTGEFFGLLLINIVWMKGATVGWVILERIVLFPAQTFALLALPVIWKYNGLRGRDSRTLKYISYAFYPVHFLLLAFIAASGVSFG